MAICSGLLASNDRSFEWTDLKTNAEEIITNFPTAINDLRNIGEKYEPISAYSLLTENNLVGEFSLSEEFVELSTQNVFSASGRNKFVSALAIQAETTPFSVGLYTCDPYTFILGINENAVFVLDTHPISETCGGNGNGIVVFTSDKSNKSCTYLVQWMLKRLLSSGITNDAKQSFAWITRGMYQVNIIDFIAASSQCFPKNK